MKIALRYGSRFVVSNMIKGVVMEVDDCASEKLPKIFTKCCKDEYSDCPVGTVFCPFYPKASCSDVTLADWQRVFKNGE